MKLVSAGRGLDHLCSPRSPFGPCCPDQGRPRPKSLGQQVAAPRRPGTQLRTVGRDPKMGLGGHVTYPVAGLVGEGRGRPGSTGRATRPRSVSSGPPHPEDAPLSRTSLKSQTGEPPPPLPPPPPPPLPGRELLCGGVSMTSSRPPRLPLQRLAPPDLAQVSALVSIAPARLSSVSPTQIQLGHSVTAIREILRRPGSAKFTTARLAALVQIQPAGLSRGRISVPLL